MSVINFNLYKSVSSHQLISFIIEELELLSGNLSPTSLCLDEVLWCMEECLKRETHGVILLTKNNRDEESEESPLTNEQKMFLKKLLQLSNYK